MMDGKWMTNERKEMLSLSLSLSMTWFYPPKGLLHVGKVPATNGDVINRNEAANRWQNEMTAVINVGSVAR